jgi:hypothetical protein
LEVPVQNAPDLENYIGQAVELWYGGKRWFVGVMTRRTKDATGNFVYTAYDPLYYLKRNVDDWYFKNTTASQAYKILAEKSGVRIANLENTRAIFKALYYQGTEGDKVAIDLLARTFQANSKKYWFRYQPDDGADGLILFERKIPDQLWMFQVGVNLTAANIEESIEETCTVVKLVNRETGKIVTKVNKDAVQQYGQLVHFDEVDKDKAATMDKDAKAALDRKSKIGITMTAEGVNPDQTIPQLYSGEWIYVEEKNTRIIGGYCIKGITHTFETNNLIRLSFEIQSTADLADIYYDDMIDKSTKQPKATSGIGIQQSYGPEVKKIMDQYN